MSRQLEELVNLERHPLSDQHFRAISRQTLDATGVLVLPQFLQTDAIARIRAEGDAHQHLAFYTGNQHNVYLAPRDATLPGQHARNRLVNSSKGCITTDQIPDSSDLHSLYQSDSFKSYLCAVLGETALYEYADSLSSINLHYAAAGQELGWHFDNSSFAITLLIQKPLAGGVFEYVRDLRDADAGDMNYAGVTAVLDNKIQPSRLAMDAGTLVLFRGRNALHRVTPTAGSITRMLVVLAYNACPGIALSESARMTFYGRLGDTLASS